MQMFHVKVTTKDEAGNPLYQTWTEPYESAADAVLEVQELVGLDAKIEVEPASPRASHE